MKPNTSRLAQTRAERRRLFDDQILLHESSPLCKALSPDYTMFSPARQPGTCFLPRGAAVSKNFQKYFCAHALKKEVGALLWQNGNETYFRETELAFLIRLFTGYLQLYPTHTKLLLALQRLRDTARAHSLLKDVFSFSIITQRPGLFSAPGVFGPGRFRAISSRRWRMPRHGHPCCASRGISPTPSSTTLGR